MKVSSINFPICNVPTDATNAALSGSVSFAAFSIGFSSGSSTDSAPTLPCSRSSACIVSDEAMISERSVDAYAYELSALTTPHTYSPLAKKCIDIIERNHGDVPLDIASASALRAIDLSAEPRFRWPLFLHFQ